MKSKLILTIAILIIMAGCNNKLKVDTSKIDLKINIVRFDTAFFNLNSIDTSEVLYNIAVLQKKYPEFFDIYNQQLLGIGSPSQKDYLDNLNNFFLYCDQMNLYEEVEKKFPLNDKSLDKSLTDAFKHFKYYFPESKPPQVYTCISGFNISVFTSDNLIGISLDKYLGSDFKPYKEMFENYLVKRMKKEMIPVDIMKATSNMKFPFNDSVKSLLNSMIYEGRSQYFIDAMMPDLADTIKWGYSAEQWKWVNKFERNIWDYLVDQKILFSNKVIDIKTYTTDAPFTSPFSQSSAPRTGVFIGYKIVETYMKNNKKVTLQQLMQIRDYMEIYNNSYYNPQ